MLSANGKGDVATGDSSRVYKCIVIGAGPGGICMGVALKQAGYDNFIIFEKEARVGGVWQINTYPGSACDSLSRIYSFSFFLNSNWSRPRAKQEELREYFEACAAQYGVLPHVRVNKKVQSVHWDDECTVWRVVLEDNSVYSAQFVVSAMGMFNRPKWPEIPGLNTFKGALCHSARWDPATIYAGKRVAVIGTGASTIQIVPAIAKEAARVHVVQRTAPWVLPKEDDPFTEEQKQRLQDHPIELRRERMQLFQNTERFCDFADQEQLDENEALARENLLAVKDPVLREKLTPKYPYGFSRPLISSEYLPTFNRGNVELVTDSIEFVTENAIVTAGGQSREIDLIIAATGFHTTEYLSAIEATGRNQISIKDVWTGGAKAYLGIMTSGFPNLFMLYGPNTNNGHIPFMIECQVAYTIRQIERMTREDLAWIDVKSEVMEQYNRKLQGDMAKVKVWQLGANGYYQSEQGLIVTQCPYVMAEYRAMVMTPDAHAFEFQHGVPLAR